MSDFLVQHDAAIRLSAFALMLAGMTAWEFAAPRRRLSVPLTGRWIANIGLVILGALIIRLAVPLAAVGVATVAAARGFGLLNVIDLPAWLAFVLAVIVLDLAIWAQHVAMHKVPLLWRLHRVHHSDVDFDSTTGVRFHPVEIVVSMAYKMAVVAAIGAPAAAVIVFEICLSSGALFNHGNVRLPLRVDRILRRLIVTPDMHRVHHSVHRRRPTPTTASICRCGTGCSAPTGTSRSTVMRAWRSVLRPFAARATATSAACSYSHWPGRSGADAACAVGPVRNRLLKNMPPGVRPGGQRSVRILFGSRAAFCRCCA